MVTIISAVRCFAISVYEVQAKFALFPTVAKSGQGSGRSCGDVAPYLPLEILKLANPVRHI